MSVKSSGLSVQKAAFQAIAHAAMAMAISRWRGRLSRRAEIGGESCFRRTERDGARTATRRAPAPRRQAVRHLRRGAAGLRHAIPRPRQRRDEGRRIEMNHRAGRRRPPARRARRTSRISLSTSRPALVGARRTIASIVASIRRRSANCPQQCRPSRCSLKCRPPPSLTCRCLVSRSRQPRSSAASSSLPGFS